MPGNKEFVIQMEVVLTRTTHGCELSGGLLRGKRVPGGGDKGEKLGKL